MDFYVKDIRPYTDCLNKICNKLREKNYFLTQSQYLKLLEFLFDESINLKKNNGKNDYNVTLEHLDCMYKICKKLKEKKYFLTKNEYFNILDILHEVDIESSMISNILCEIEKPLVKRTKTLEIYTDGSHFKNGGSGRKGFGAYFVPIKNGEGGFIPKNISIEIDQKFMKSEFGVTETEISNPTMEIAACCYSLKSMVENLDKLQDIKLIKSYADYEGVQFWLNGSWRITKPYIRKIVDLIRVYEETLKKVGINIEYIHVDGHSGIYGNEMADKLAKGLVKP